jgi:hypothetical protein
MLQTLHTACFAGFADAMRSRAQHTHNSIQAHPDTVGFDNAWEVYWFSVGKV